MSKKVIIVGGVAGFKVKNLTGGYRTFRMSGMPSKT